MSQDPSIRGSVHLLTSRAEELERLARSFDGTWMSVLAGLGVKQFGVVRQYSNSLVSGGVPRAAFVAQSTSMCTTLQ